MNYLISAGLGAYLLPTITCLVALPSLYIYLSIDAHRDCAAAVQAILEKGEDRASAQKLAERMESDLEIFDLEWWILAAFAVMIAGIMAIGHVAALPRAACPDGTEQISVIQAAMSVYATLIGLAVAFRLGWARMTIARNMRAHWLLAAARNSQAKSRKG